MPPHRPSLLVPRGGAGHAFLDARTILQLRPAIEMAEQQDTRLKQRFNSQHSVPGIEPMGKFVMNFGTIEFDSYFWFVFLAFPFQGRRVPIEQVMARLAGSRFARRDGWLLDLTGMLPPEADPSPEQVFAGAPAGAY